MARNETFSNMYDVLRGQWYGAIVDEDGEIDIGRCSNFSPAGSAPQVETLTEVHAGLETPVRSVVISQDFNFSFAVRDLTPAGRARLLAGGNAPTIDTASRLLRFSVQGNKLKLDRESGLPAAYRLPGITGLPQAYNITVFPPPTSVTCAEDATVGTFAADDYYVWAVPVYRDTDGKHGPTDANFTLANWPNLIRGVDYNVGTPAQDGAAPVAILLNKSIRVQFDEPSIPAGVSQPTHFIVVVGTVDDIEDADSHVAALSAWADASQDLTISAPGTVDFATTPTLPGYIRVETGVVTAGVRVWTAATEDTDYTVDRINNTIKLKAGGAISDAELVRINVWYNANPTDLHKHGSVGTAAERYEWFRFRNFSPDGTDPGSRQPEGLVVDMPRINTAAIGGQIASTGKEGFHDPVPFSNMLAEYDSAQTCSVMAKRLGSDNVENLDWYSDDITPANG